MATKPAESKVVRIKAEKLLPTPAGELARLRALMDGPIDTSDSPERTAKARRLKRTASGALPQPLPELRKSPLRLAILAQLERLQMTRYQLWKAAQRISPKIPASAVYEYLRGQRAIGTPYVEALMEAARLTVKPAGNQKKARVKTGQIA